MASDAEREELDAVDHGAEETCERSRRVPNPAGGAGKKKLEIKYIHDQRHKMQIYHKRKAGLLKKLDELHKLTGAEIIFVMREPNGKTLSFSSKSFARKTKNIVENLHEFEDE